MIAPAAFAPAAPKVRVEPCACGGSIASVDLPEFYALAVAAHNTRREHRAWRRRVGR